MTEPLPADVMPETSIPFLGREIWVRFPRPEQIMVWNRTVKTLTEVPEGTEWTAPAVMKALERCRAIVDSLIMNQVDIDWLDDEMLAGRIGFTQVAPFITAVLDKFQSLAAESLATDGTREERRTAKKAAPKKARPQGTDHVNSRGRRTQRRQAQRTAENQARRELRALELSYRTRKRRKT